MGVTRHIGACALALTLAISGTALTTGCKDSRTLKNVEHDQTADQVDHESTTRVKVSAGDGKADPMANSKSYKIVKKSKNKKHKNITVTYSSKNPETKLPVPDYLYDKGSKNHTEATKGVNPDKGTTGNSRSDKNRSENDKSESKPQKNKSQTKSSTNSGKKNSKNGSSKKNKNSSGKRASNKRGKGDSPSKGGTSGNKGSSYKGKAKVYDTTGDNPELPDVGKIAAYGSYATIVQMLGGQDGKTALVATNSKLLKGSFKPVFSDEGSSSIISGWKGDGEDSSKADMDAIVKAKPDTVLVPSSSYFTKKQSSVLAQHKISVTVMPTLTSATRIRTAVKNVGTMLDKATDGISSSRASDYDEYHEDLVKRVQAGNATKNGYGRHSGGSAYDADRKSQPGLYDSNMYTLYIGEWDYGASYNGTGRLRGAVSSSKSGVGLAVLGYRTSPVSYYMGVAGVVNNAAAIDESETHDGLLAPVWEFSTSLFTDLDTEISWSKISTSKRVMSFSGEGFSRVTLTQAATKQSDIGKKGFGSENFPKVIVKNTKMKRAFIKGSTGRGIYRHYDNGADGSPGFKYHGTLVYSTILTDDLENDVLVNPKGLFESWTDGSPESCLESAWLAGVSAFGNKSGVNVKGEIESFYQKFYRYDVSDTEVNRMLKGSGI